MLVPHHTASRAPALLALPVPPAPRSSRPPAPKYPSHPLPHFPAGAPSSRCEYPVRQEWKDEHLMRRLLEDIKMHLPARHTKVVRVMPSTVEMNAGCAPRIHAPADARAPAQCTIARSLLFHRRLLARATTRTPPLTRCHDSVADLVTEKALHKKYEEFIRHFSNPPRGNPQARWLYNRRGQQLKVQSVAVI